MNNLVPAVWPARVLTGLVGGLGRYDVTLESMRPGSAFLTDLGASPDPGVPYVLLAGNRSLPPAAVESGPAGGSRLGRLLSRLNLKGGLGAVADGVFFGRPNDLAVSVVSMSRLPDNWPAADRGRPVACDHLSYFSDPIALAALADALTAGG